MRRPAQDLHNKYTNATLTRGSVSETVTLGAAAAATTGRGRLLEEFASAGQVENSSIFTFESRGLNALSRTAFGIPSVMEALDSCP